jgi:hypothetical protein
LRGKSAADATWVNATVETAAITVSPEFWRRKRNTRAILCGQRDVRLWVKSRHVQGTHVCPLSANSGTRRPSLNRQIRNSSGFHRTKRAAGKFSNKWEGGLNHETIYRGVRDAIERDVFLIRAKPDQLRPQRAFVWRQLWQTSGRHLPSASEACLQILCLPALLASSPSISPRVPASSILALKRHCERHVLKPKA